MFERSISVGLDHGGARCAGESEGGWPANCATSEQYEHRSLPNCIEDAAEADDGAREGAATTRVNEPMIEAFEVPNSPRSQKEPMFTDDKKPNLLRTEPYDHQ